jgi:hypothetical protein
MHGDHVKEIFRLPRQAAIAQGEFGDFTSPSTASLLDLRATWCVRTFFSFTGHTMGRRQQKIRKIDPSVSC